MLSHNTCKAKTRDTQEKAVAKNREWSRAEPGKFSDFDLSERYREAISLKCSDFDLSERYREAISLKFSDFDLSERHREAISQKTFFFRF